MYRVELKVGYVYRECGEAVEFLMYRVELKG